MLIIFCSDLMATKLPCRIFKTRGKLARPWGWRAVTPACRGASNIILFVCHFIVKYNIWTYFIIFILNLECVDLRFVTYAKLQIHQSLISSDFTLQVCRTSAVVAIIIKSEVILIQSKQVLNFSAVINKYCFSQQFVGGGRSYIH